MPGVAHTYSSVSGIVPGTLQQIPDVMVGKLQSLKSAVEAAALQPHMGTSPQMFGCGFFFCLSSAWGKYGVVTTVQTQRPEIHPSV